MRFMLAWALTILILFLHPVAAVSQEPPSPTHQADVLRAVAGGKGKNALVYYESQAARFENLANSAESPRAYWQSAAQAYRLASITARYLGNFHKGIMYAERMLALAEKIGSPDLKLLAISSLYTAHRSTRNFSKAAAFTELGFKILDEVPANSIDRIWWSSSFLRYRADDFRQQQEYEKAAEAYLQSISLKEDYLKKFSGDGDRAANRIEVARSLQLNAYSSLAGTYLTIGKLDLAFETYERGLAVTQEWGLEYPRINFYLGLGNVLRRRVQLAGALDNYQRALELARRQQRPEMIASAARHIGDILRSSGKAAEALVFYGEAVQQIESVRSLLATQNNRESYFGDSLEAYQGAIAALWETATFDQAFHYGERVRSRSFLDLLGSKVRLSKTKSGLVEEELALADADDEQTAEQAYGKFLEKVRKTSPEQASLMSVEPLTLKQVQALLEPQQALLEYLVTSQKVYLWVLDKQQVRAFAIPVAKKDVVAKVQALRTAISELRHLKEYQAIARDLYQELVAPAKSFVTGKELIIVPHDVLHYLPFHALYAPQGKYLLEDRSVTYLSSASLLQFTAAKRKPLGEKVLAVGNPDRVDPTKELKFAELEADEIKKLYPSSTVLLKKEATKLEAKRVSPQHQILHFAAHAELKGDDPLSSAILVVKDGGDDGRLEVREIFEMDLNASLVVLSGCETGLGKLSSGDEFIGLTRAFIYAGTPSVVASLWKVDDASTASLMSSFYKNLKTKTKGEALRQAQLEMIRGKVSRELLAQRGVGGVGKLGQTAAAKSPSQNSIFVSHPYFWAPFILVGDGK